MKRGKPLDSGAKYLSIQSLIDKFKNTNTCVPVLHSFIKKYNLLDENIQQIINTPPPQNSQVQVTMVDFNKEEEE